MRIALAVAGVALMVAVSLWFLLRLKKIVIIEADKNSNDSIRSSTEPLTQKDLYPFPDLLWAGAIGGICLWVLGIDDGGKGALFAQHFFFIAIPISMVISLSLAFIIVLPISILLRGFKVLNFFTVNLFGVLIGLCVSLFQPKFLPLRDRLDFNWDASLWFISIAFGFSIASALRAPTKQS